MRQEFIFLVISILLFVGCSQLQQDPPEQPNILFAIADDASFPHMGIYGTSGVKTPNFDRVDREGV